MKRSSVSSSCLQRSGGTNGAVTTPAGGSPKPASVTILNTETLPTYSCERYYMLSEIEMNAPPVVFLSHLERHGDNDDEDQDTVDTETDEKTTEQQQQQQHHSSTSLSTFPPCLILYILWRPTVEQDADSFMVTTLQAQVKRLQQHVELVSFEEVASRILMRDNKNNNSSSRASTTTTNTKLDATINGETKAPGPNENGDATTEAKGKNGVEQHDKAENDTERTNGSSSNSNNGSSSSNQKPKCCVYIVVDRLLSTSTTDGTDKVSEQLARAVAMNETFRAMIQGITVGVSNHVRAAPGLEACHDAVSLGARDRRKVEIPIAKSFLGIVADSPDDLLGLADPNECDAAQGVLQLKISAEYNGRGNLHSFATRAHGVWRQRHGLPPSQNTTARRTPRRIRRLPTPNSRETEFLIYDTIAILVLILYISFHSGHLLFQKP
jgi:hypothetical protein